MQSWIISTKLHPLCFIAFSKISAVCLISLALHLAIKLALEARANLTGFNGLNFSPSGLALLLYPCCEVAVGCPVVREKS
jgi:hypothetical protein